MNYRIKHETIGVYLVSQAFNSSTYEKLETKSGGTINTNYAVMVAELLDGSRLDSIATYFLWVSFIIQEMFILFHLSLFLNSLRCITNILHSCLICLWYSSIREIIYSRPIPLYYLHV